MSTAVLVHPIHTKADHIAALKRVEELWGAKRNTPDGDELDVLVDLVEAYENRQHRVPDTGPIGVLRHLMEANNLTQRDVPEIGAQSVVSAILAGKRTLNTRMIAALAKRFHVSPSAFIE
jgi:HTH-type transcriptional regulator/antitoxin HigA